MQSLVAGTPEEVPQPLRRRGAFWGSVGRPWARSRDDRDHGPPLFSLWHEGREKTGNTKNQKPKTRKAPNTRSKPDRPVSLVLGLWSFSGVWCLVFGVCATCAVCASTLADWPNFLGPNADGRSPETGLLGSWTTNGVPVLWDRQVGAGYSAPSVLGNRLVLHHRINDEEIVECLDPATGKPIWRYAYPTHYIDPYGYNNGPRSTPLLFSNRCCTFGAEGKLTCLELDSGKILWQRDTGPDFNVPEAFFGVGSTPILERGLLIVTVGGQPNSGVVAFDPETGQTVWQSVGKANWEGIPMTGWPGERTVRWQPSDKQASYSTPVAATIHGKRQILCLTRQGLVSLDPKNGTVNFSFWFRSRVEESVNAMNPIAVDNLIFISAAYYKIGSVLLRVKPDGKSVEEVWRSTVLEQHWNTPIYHDGYLYAFSGRNEPDAHFRCVEFKTGKLMWDRDESWGFHSRETPSVYGRGSAIVADGRLVVLGEGGMLGMFKLNPHQPEEICRWQVPHVHPPCWAGPVLSNKRLYLRSEDHLVCLDLAQ